MGLFLSRFHVVAGISAFYFLIPHQEATEKLNQSSVLQTRTDASMGRAMLSGSAGPGQAARVMVRG